MKFNIKIRRYQSNQERILYENRRVCLNLKMPSYDQFNKIADLRPYFLNHPDDEMVKLSCLHFLGDDAQIWWHENQLPDKIKIANELEFSQTCEVCGQPKEENYTLENGTHATHLHECKSINFEAGHECDQCKKFFQLDQLHEFNSGLSCRSCLPF